MAAGWCGDPEEEEEGADSQQRPMARSGRAATAAVVATRRVTFMNSVHPSSATRESRAGRGGGGQVATMKVQTHKK